MSFYLSSCKRNIMYKFLDIGTVHDINVHAQLSSKMGQINLNRYSHFEMYYELLNRKMR